MPSRFWNTAPRGMGHVPIVDPKTVRQTKSEFLPVTPKRELSWAETARFRERTMVERKAYARLKDEFGGRYVRVRGASKVMAHLMFGVLALTADQLRRLEPGTSCDVARSFSCFRSGRDGGAVLKNNEKRDSSL